MIPGPATCRRCAAAPPEPLDGFCGACLRLRAAEALADAEAVSVALRGGARAPSLTDRFPPARAKRKPPRRCERCRGPGGRRYATDGLCGPCRDTLRAEQDARSGRG